MNRATVSSVQYLVPRDTLAEVPGEGPALELGPHAGKSLLLVLEVSEVIEQESLHVSVWASEDGQDWGTQPLITFPQKFYEGITPAALHLWQRPEVKYLQARWQVYRFGRGYAQPWFRFGVELQDLA